MPELPQMWFILPIRGTFVLFFVLAFGMLGFIAKSVIKWLLGS